MRHAGRLGCGQASGSSWYLMAAGGAAGRPRQEAHAREGARPPLGHLRDKGPVSTDAKHPRSRGHTSPESIQRRAVPDGFLLADTRRWAACPRARQVGELTHASTGRTCHAHPWYMLMSCTRTCHAHTDAPLPAPSGRTGRARVRYGCLGSRAAQHHGRTRRRQSSRPHGRTAGDGRCAPLKFGRERITPSAVMPARVFWCECSHQAPRKFESENKCESTPL